MNDFKHWLNLLYETEGEPKGEAWRELVPEGFMAHFKEYVETYARLSKPNMRDQLIVLIKLWNEIFKNLKLLDSLDPLGKKYDKVLRRVLNSMKVWSTTLTRLGLTLTAQSYIPKEEREAIPIKDMLKMQNKMDKLAKEFNGNAKKMKKSKGRKDVEQITYRRKKSEKGDTGKDS